jgi:hypothetical protein
MKHNAFGNFDHTGDNIFADHRDIAALRNKATRFGFTLVESPA